MVENRTFKKEMGNRYLVGIISLLLVVLLLCAQNYIAALIAAIFLGAVIIQSLFLRKRFKTFLKYEESLASKSVREKIRIILSNNKLLNLYLHYGTTENFERFENYFETLSEYDPLYDSLKNMLSLAEDCGKFNSNL